MVLFSVSCRVQKFHKACPKPNLSVTNRSSKRNDTDSSRHMAELQSKDNGSHRHKTIGCRLCELVSHPEYLNSSNGSGVMRTRSKTAWETNRTRNKAANQTVMSCQCSSRYTHPFMAEYLTLSCQCRSRYTHPFMAEYLTLSCRTSGEGCKNHPMPVMGPTRMHRNAQVGKSVITSVIK